MSLERSQEKVTLKPAETLHSMDLGQFPMS